MSGVGEQSKMVGRFKTARKPKSARAEYLARKKAKALAALVRQERRILRRSLVDLGVTLGYGTGAEISRALAVLEKEGKQ